MVACMVTPGHRCEGRFLQIRCSAFFPGTLSLPALVCHLPTFLTIECEKNSVVKHTKTEVPQAETCWVGRQVCAQDLANALANNPLSRLSGP